MHMSDIEWSAVERMSSTIGEIAISAMLKSLDTGQHHAAVASFIRNNNFAERKKKFLASQARLLTGHAVDRTRCSTDRAIKTAAI